MDASIKFLYAEHPFFDKKVTMGNFLEYLTGEKQYMKCPKCGKDVRIIPYGYGYVASCCGKVLYNAKTLPEGANAKS